MINEVGIQLLPEERALISAKMRKYNADEAKVEEDGNGFMKIHYYRKPVPFEHIRRITGYLVGTLFRWNSAKRAEERDRVKHGVSVG